MTYTERGTNELVMIKSYFHKCIPIMKISKLLNCSRQTTYNVTTFLRKGHTALITISSIKKIKSDVADVSFLYLMNN